LVIELRYLLNIGYLTEKTENRDKFSFTL